ncbi:MAG TPA: hypothetical protein VJ396_09210 [Acidiferrobacterales bacterium]|nr:hypothetical protein [Acidiferrobacterales bacterium]
MSAIFSGKRSGPVWDAINKAKTVSDLREALYFVGCKLQELETKVDQHEHTRPVIVSGQYWTSTAAN